MLITTAVVPGPPALVVELMGSAAHELDDLRAATDRVLSTALSDLVSASAGGPVQLVVVGPGRPQELNAAGAVSFASFGRDVVIPALVGGERGDRVLPTPIMVARYLASRDIASHREHAELWASARWVTTSGVDATALGEQLGADGTGIGLILVADGAACHGPKAPRAQDARAEAYDEAVRSALSSGQPGRVAQIDADLGDELGATWSQVWPVLVAAASAGSAAGLEGLAGAAGSADLDWVGAASWAGAPYGVGWAVASWRRAPWSAVSAQA